MLKIPKGKITTYGILARYHKTSPRAIGMIMKHNKEPHRYPCYRVILSSGKVGNYSVIGGIRRKIALLKKDGIVIMNGRIDLKKYLYKFT